MFVCAPTFLTLKKIGLRGETGYFATAFYSGRALASLNELVLFRRLNLFFRLDLESNEEWQRGYVAPDALLWFIQKQNQKGTTVTLYVNKKAHAKMYIGQSGVLTGSANLTTTGFGGGCEIVRVDTANAKQRAVRTIKSYASTFTLLSASQLRRYVQTKAPAKIEITADKLPAIGSDVGGGLEEYAKFKRWLRQQSGPAARLTYRNALGHNNQGGHVRSDFFGIRQYLVAYAERIDEFAGLDPQEYRLVTDPNTTVQFKSFVLKNAVDAAPFRLQTWKNYLPHGLGGNATTGGATSGHLNRMLPQVARYLKSVNI